MNLVSYESAVDVGILPPFSCATCGNTPSTASKAVYSPMVDTQRDQDCGVVWAGNGRVYVCEACVRSMCGLFGLGDTAAQDGVLASLRERAESAEKQLTAVKGLIDVARGLAEKNRTEDTGKTVEQVAEATAAVNTLEDLDGEVHQAMTDNVEIVVGTPPADLTGGHPLADWGKDGTEPA